MASKSPRSPAAGSRAAATMYVDQQQDPLSQHAVRSCWSHDVQGQLQRQFGFFPKGQPGRNAFRQEV